MIYDLILVLIFLLLILINVYRGAARAIVGTLCSLVSYLAATSLGKVFSDWIYKVVIDPAIDKAVVNAINNTAEDAVNSVTGYLPEWISDLLHLNSLDISSFVGDKISSHSDVITTAVNDAVRPIAISLLSALITILLFFLIYILLRVIAVKPLLMLSELPFIRGANRILGGVIGFIDAFLLVSLLAYLLRVLLPAVGSDTGILNESTIYNSFIFYHFYSGNIFTAITSAIGIR